MGVTGAARTVGATPDIDGDGGAICVGAIVGILAASPRLACSRAVAKAATLAKRCVGSLASAVNMTCSTSGEIEGTFSRREGTGDSICLTAISVNEPEKGRSPLNHS